MVFHRLFGISDHHRRQLASLLMRDFDYIMRMKVKRLSEKECFCTAKKFSSTFGQINGRQIKWHTISVENVAEKLHLWNHYVIFFVTGAVPLARRSINRLSYWTLHCAFLTSAHRSELLRDRITLTQPIIMEKHAKIVSVYNGLNEQPASWYAFFAIRFRP